MLMIINKLITHLNKIKHKIIPLLIKQQCASKDEFSSDTSYNAYQEAKRATEENKRQNGGHTAGIGGSWAVQDGQDYNSWKKAQNDFDNFKRQNSEVIQQ